MAINQIDRLKQEVIEEYITWARMCESKHGLPWPIHADELRDVELSTLLAEIKKLKVLGRTPPE